MRNHLSVEGKEVDGRDREIIAIAQAGLDNVRPGVLLGRAGAHFEIGEAVRVARSVTLAAMGKAALAMAESVVTSLDNPVHRLLIGVPHGYTSQWGDTLGTTAQIINCGHPSPDEQSARFGQMVLDAAGSCSNGDLLIVLISGGTSAVSFVPPAGISMDEVRVLFKALNDRAIPIGEINTVRKHVSMVAGGRVAAAAYPARTLTFVLSDVPDDDPEFIGSGPTVGSKLTAADALAVLGRYDCLPQIPPSIVEWLKSPGAAVVHPDDMRLDTSLTRIIGTVQDAINGAAEYASSRGYGVSIADTRMTGESRDAGNLAARTLLSAVAPGECYVWGGETVVNVTGSGRGGRNLELALAAAVHLESAPLSTRFVSLATDGVDGSTTYAGALVGPDTTATARRKGLDPHRFLANNDSFAFFRQVGGLIHSGPTHTNVMDIQIGLAG